MGIVAVLCVTNSVHDCVCAIHGSISLHFCRTRGFDVWYDVRIHSVWVLILVLCGCFYFRVVAMYASSQTPVSQCHHVLNHMANPQKVCMTILSLLYCLLACKPRYWSSMAFQVICMRFNSWYCSFVSHELGCRVYKTLNDGWGVKQRCRAFIEEIIGECAGNRQWEWCNAA